MTIDLFALGSKHCNLLFNTQERVPAFREIILSDFTDIMNHYKTVESCSGKADAFRLLGLDGGYRKGFVELHMKSGSTLEQATARFNTWVSRCTRRFFFRTPRMQLKRKAEFLEVERPDESALVDPRFTIALDGLKKSKNRVRATLV